MNQALAKSTPGLGPSGFHPHASGLRPARSACRSFQATTAASSAAFGRKRTPQWPIRHQALPARGFRGISLFAALSAVFHDPLHAAWLWIVRAYRVLPKAAEQIHPAVVCFHSQRARRHPLRGCCFEKRLFPAPKHSALKQIGKSACGQALVGISPVRGNQPFRINRL